MVYGAARQVRRGPSGRSRSTCRLVEWGRPAVAELLVDTPAPRTSYATDQRHLLSYCALPTSRSSSSRVTNSPCEPVPRRSRFLPGPANRRRLSTVASDRAALRFWTWSSCGPISAQLFQPSSSHSVSDFQSFAFESRLIGQVQLALSRNTASTTRLGQAFRRS